MLFMKITVCASIGFYDDIVKVGKELEEMGHEVRLPSFEVEDEKGEKISVKEFYSFRKSGGNCDNWVWERKGEEMRNHFEKIEWCEAVLVLNYEKNNIPGYIGANTLMEMGIAFYLEKTIYLLNNIPDINYREEILAMKPVIINNDLREI